MKLLSFIFTVKIIPFFSIALLYLTLFFILSSSHSGDVFVGRMLKKNHPYRLPMLGHYIFTAVIEDLVRLYKINGKKTKVCIMYFKLKKMV